MLIVLGNKEGKISKIMGIVLYLLYCVLAAIPPYSENVGLIPSLIGLGVIALVGVCFLSIEKKLDKRFDWSYGKNIFIACIITLGIILLICGTLILFEWLIKTLF